MRVTWLIAFAAIISQVACNIAAVPDPPEACSADLRSSIHWGSATSSYQVEGGWNADGKSPSIWDTLSQTPGTIKDNSTGDVACDHYNKWQEDVALMKKLGMKNYRFSIAWPRIIPGGVKGSPVNEAGVNWYRQLILALLDAGIEPAVTMYHWDLPQVLQDNYGGFMSTKIQDDFVYYADTIFTHLGDLVTQWMTFNEVISICELGYQKNVFAPQLDGGPAAKYTCGHNVLLAHAKTVELYNKKYRATQKGRISLALDGKWGYPNDINNPADVAAAQAFMEFQYSWMADPLYFGDYPKLMRDTQGDDLPVFTPAEKELLKSARPDFFGVNFYCGYNVKAPASGAPLGKTYVVEPFTSPGIPTNASWLFVTPDGLRKTLVWLHKRYDGPEFWITENGVTVLDEEFTAVPGVLKDTFRQDFYSGYLNNLCLAKSEDGVKVTHYFAWAFMDNFEWVDGFSKRFGLVYVDLKDPKLTRYPKDTALWLSKHFFKMSPAKNIEASVDENTEGAVTLTDSGARASSGSTKQVL